MAWPGRTDILAPSRRLGPGRRVFNAFLPQLATAAAVSLLTCACYILLAYQQWHNFYTPSWDLGIFTQLAKSYAALQAPVVPIKGSGFNLLGDHFHPLLIVMGPIYALFPSAFTLLAVQAACFGLAAGVFTVTACRVIGRGLSLPQKFSLPVTFLTSMAFGLSWGLQTAAAAQFHEIALAVPLLTLSLHYWITGRYGASSLWAAPLVFVKEDLGLTLLVYGVVVFWRSWSSGSQRGTEGRPHIFQTYAGLWLGVWGVLWFVVSSFVVLPIFNINSEYAYTKKSGFSKLVADPWGTITEIFTNSEKMWTVFLLIAVSAGAPLLSSLSFAMLPTLAWRFLSPEPFYWGPAWHYSAILMPLAMAALLDLIVRLSRKPRKPPFRKKMADRSIRGRILRRRAACYAMLSLTIMTAVFSVFFFPLKDTLTLKKYHDNPRQYAAQEALKVIRADATVETDVALMSYLVDSHARQSSALSPINTVYWIGNPTNPAPDYVVIDTNFWSEGQLGRSKDVAAYAMERHPGTVYGTIFDQGGYHVAARLLRQ